MVICEGDKSSTFISVDDDGLRRYVVRGTSFRDRRSGWNGHVYDMLALGVRGVVVAVS